ncbi:MAG: phosphatase PAP2 family protein [Candidatus Saccharibacteria bacterium]|nr:phosphatase PAP2 family protein [Candidatus Saccharibacteria bacterium]
MDRITIFAAQYLIYIIAITILFYVLLRLPRGELKTFITLCGMGIVAAFIMVKVAGSIYYNPRPFVDGNFMPLFPHSSTNGFPSNHTVAAVLAALLLWRYSRNVAVGLFIAACLVGLARVLASVHHIEDIIGGIVIATFAALFANLVLHHISNRKVSKTDN